MPTAAFLNSSPPAATLVPSLSGPCRPGPEFDSRDLRRAFGKFASGVTVITTVLDGGGKVGFTANSFASVSLDPPLVSWNYRKASLHLADMLAARYFLVHVLSVKQLELSQRMARPADDKFAGLALEQGLGGVPRLAGALATFECERWQTVEAGDHVIFIARVQRYGQEDGDALLFLNGAYARSVMPVTHEASQ